MKKNGIPGMFLMVMSLIYGCAQPEARESSTVVDREYPVKVQSLKMETITRTLDYTANLNAFEEVYFAPASPGRIEKIHVDVGDRVRKGQALIEMDRTQLQQARIQMQNARSNFLRLDTLYRLESISEQQYEQVKTQYEVARSNVAFLQENTTLLSPISGVVTARYYESKEMYSGAPNTGEGKAAVVRLMQINPLKAFVSISERYFPEIKEDMKARIKLDMYPGESFRGRVYRVHPTVDEATRTFQTEILIDNPDEKLRPGMFARVMLELRSDRAITVPAVSVMQQEGTNNRYIYVSNDGTARKIMVTIGKRFDDRQEIISDSLREGMQLVVAGQASLEEGARLKVVDQ
jgi:RND family efflux transporter MFP subunit